MYRNVLKNQNLLPYLLAGSASRLGDVLSGMAFLFMAYDLTGSTMLTTWMAMAETVPYLLFGLLGGAIADRLPTKWLLVTLDVLRIPLVASIVLLHTLDLLTYPYLLVVSFLIQTIGCFFNPAHRSLLPMLVVKQERTTANSLFDTLTRGITVVSPFLSVWLLNRFGVVHFFTVDAISYGLSAVLLSRIHITPKKEGKSHVSIRSTFQSIKNFTVWSYQNAEIKVLFLFTFITVFFNTWVWEVGLLLALTEVSSNAKEVYASLQGVFGATVILVNLLLPYLFKKMTIGHYLLGASIWGFGILYYGILYNVSHFVIGVGIVGIGLPLAGLTRVYVLQTFVPEEMLARGFSFNAVLLYGANTLSLAIYGGLSHYWSPQILMTVSGGLMLLSSIIGIILVRILSSKHRRRFSIYFSK